jgi:glucokinase
VRSYQVEGWDGFPLADWLVQNLGIPQATIQNDADTAGLAEARFGAGRDASPVFYVTIGSGIGGALIIDGQIYRGAGQGAAEIGHLLVPYHEDGPGLRELEQVASGWGIGRQGELAARRMIQAGASDWSVLKNAGNDPGRITGLLVAQAALRGDNIASNILDRARKAVVFALNQTIALLAPRRIILGGGVSLIGEEHWHAPIRSLVEQEVFAPFRSTFDIVGPALEEEVVVHGAVALARDLVRNQG